MYEAHGQWKIVIQGNCVLQWFSGLWNEEAMITYAAEFRKKTEHLNGTKWAIMSFFDDWELGTPAIEPHAIKHCEDFINNGCIKDCHVYLPNYLKEMQLEKMIPQKDEKYERQVFDQTQKAVDWLNTFDFNADVNAFRKELPITSLFE